MAINVLVEALLPGGGVKGRGGKSPSKDEKGLKEWIRNKLKALSFLQGRLGVKAAEAFPGIMGAILSWILNKAADVVGWASQSLWALVVGIGGLLALHVHGYQKVNNYAMRHRNIIQCSSCHKTPPIPIMLINANSLQCCSLLGV